MHRDHLGAELVRELGDALGSPERVVEQDKVGSQPAERVLQRPDAQGDPVAVGRHHAQRAHLVATALVQLATTGDDDVVLEQAARVGHPRFLVEIRPDSAAAGPVEHRDVDDDRPGRAAGSKRRHSGPCP